MDSPRRRIRDRAPLALLTASALLATTITSATAATESATGPEDADRWHTAHAGVGSGGEVITHDDGTLTFDAVGNSGKIADSEDGFWYHYTEVDPETENFTLEATFEVEDASGKDNQSGFGLIAVDDFIPNSGAARYFNSAGTQVAKYHTSLDGETGTRYGTPGGKVVHGYTEAPTQNSPDRDMTDSRAFDWHHKDGLVEGDNTNPPRFEAGDVYELSLRKSNTGFHAMWHRDGEELESVSYDPDMLLVQDEERYYVGLFTARNIRTAVTDWSFTTIHPDDDEDPLERPTEQVTPTLSTDITSTTPHAEIEVPLLADAYGEAVILDEDGEEATETVDLEPGQRELVELAGLEPGDNSFTARLTPHEEQLHYEDWEELASTDPVELELSFHVARYGDPGESLHVAPNGDADGDGTQADPLDLPTAVAYAQPGQQIVLAEGAYRLQEAIVVERGRDGTSEEPITLMSSPEGRATLDLSESSSGGLVLRGDHWHIHDLEITRSRGYQKPLLIQGHHNVIERIETHHNGDTGLQISGNGNEPFEMWPSHNLVVSSESHNNADPNVNDADGFAAKLTVGEGNVFRHTISHHNIDDGYDLYAKSTTGSIGTVTIEDSVAYNNGWLEEQGLDVLRQGNGFKLGGESMPGDHLLRNSVAYNNLSHGVTSNSGPDVRLQDVTTVGNGLVSEEMGGSGIQLHTNAPETAYEITGALSWRGSREDSLQLDQEDTSLLQDPSNYFDGQRAGEDDSRPAEVTEDWFESVDVDGVRPEIGEDGSVQMHGLLELTDVAPEGTGARIGAIEEPTVIELMPEVGSGSGDGGAGDGDRTPPRGPGNNNGKGHGAGEHPVRG
ncbi:MULTISPECIES: right-handed parallel beta-helix repeat-containing protein [Actinomycetes]|uniref:Right handed beta helix domain-containing protein n=2 Tax=Actinomycetes TaxID=1760 RepID=A0ABP6LWQ8_9MICC